MCQITKQDNMSYFMKKIKITPDKLSLLNISK